MYSLKMSVSRGPWMACDEKMCAPDIFSPANAFPCFLQWFWSRPHPRPHIRSSQPCDQDQDERECSPCKVGRPWLVHTAEGSRHTAPGSIFIININVLAIIEQHYYILILKRSFDLSKYKSVKARSTKVKLELESTHLIRKWYTLVVI